MGDGGGGEGVGGSERGARIWEVGGRAGEEERGSEGRLRGGV